MSTPNRRPRPARRTPLPPALLGGLLRLAWQDVRRHMVEDVRAAGFADLQDAHLSVFQYPGPDGLRPSDLARQLRMTRQAANYLIGQLEAMEYIERRLAAPGERRHIHLTPRGYRLMRAIKASVRRFETRWERTVGRAKFTAFMAVLREMAREGAAVEAQRRDGRTS